MRDIGMARRIVAFAIVFAIGAAADAEPPNRAEPLPGITVSGQPSEAALEELAGSGFVAVIDLRSSEEDRGFDERGAVERLGMRYIPLPIAGPDAVTYENAAALNAALRDLRHPVLIHCSTGNRAGALLSLRQRLNGASAAEALATGIEGGMRAPALRTAVELQLAAPPQESPVSPPPAAR